MQTLGEKLLAAGAVTQEDFNRVARQRTIEKENKRKKKERARRAKRKAEEERVRAAERQVLQEAADELLDRVQRSVGESK